MNNLSKYRKEAGLTQEQLADILGITKAGVSFLEKRKLSFASAKKCAEILHVNPFELLGSDILRAIPYTDEEKAILIDMIKGL